MYIIHGNARNIYYHQDEFFGISRNVIYGNLQDIYYVTRSRPGTRRGITESRS